MNTERLNAIIQMIPAWNETDTYDEDIEKTAVIEELITELKNSSGIENRNGV